ncbi:acyl-CoA thioesterase [Salibacteraceae bacterium]|nr:acyl-CoA thioesterase [Salibacteraceae bacterium]
MQNPHVIDIRLDWSEVDSFQHVNNVAYFKYAQSARVALCDSVGIAVDAASTKPGFLVAKSECEFLSPLNYPGVIQVRSVVTKLGTTSIGISHEIFEENGQCSAKLKDVIVLYDFHSKRKVAISDELRNQLLNIA